MATDETVQELRRKILEAERSELERHAGAHLRLEPVPSDPESDDSDWEAPPRPPDRPPAA